MSPPELSRSGSGVARPGSLPWLLKMQLLVGWRTTFTRRVRVALAATAALLILGAALLAPRLWELRGALSSAPQLYGSGLLIVGAASLFVFLLMFSAAISATLEALYERGDLDLLLGAPISPRTVLASRLLGVAVSVLTVYTALAVPVLIFALAAGVWRLLGLLPWLVSLALLSASLGGLTTLGLVRWIGVRRARTAASIVGAFSGAAFFLVSQWPNLRGRSPAPIIGQEQITGLQAALAGGGPLGEDSLLWYPARVLWLEPLPTLVVLTFSAGVFWLSVRLLERTFQRGAQQAGIHGETRAARRVSSGPLRFRAGSAAVLYKEWRLLARDPLLLSRILLQVVFLLPLAFILLRSGTGSGTLVGGGGVLVLGSLAGSLAMITTNAEEAPDLLLAAPQRLSHLRWLKLWAAVLPVLVVWLLLNLGGVVRSPTWVSLLGAVLALWSILGSALIVLWRPLELRRADLFRRGQNRDLLTGLITLSMQTGLLLALFFLPSVPVYGWLGLLLAVVSPLLALSRRKISGQG